MLIHGDCVDVMAGMAEHSVDAIVTDPPYGLEFMGKEWDRLEPDRQRWAGTEHTSFAPKERKSGDEFSARMNSNPGFAQHRNPRCKKCGRCKFSGTPCECETPEWDLRSYGPQQYEWHLRWAAEALRVLKPGGHLVAFGGTRTVHRLTVALEDAGFEIRDTLCWLYGSGFPKSLNVGKAIDRAAGVEREIVGANPTWRETKRTNRIMEPVRGGAAEVLTVPATDDAKQWDGWGTALKPAHEPIVLARKPLSEKNVAANVLRWGTGAINVDGCRIGADERTYKMSGAPGGNGQRLHGGDGRDVETARRYAEESKAKPSATVTGRWPANVALDEEAARLLDDQSGERGGSGKSSGPTLTGKSVSVARGQFNGVEDTPFYGDRGGASRFFYTSKASRSERQEGPLLSGLKNQHPTVKPVDLMRWLIRLVTPAGGTVIDPFLGSGTTGVAARLEGVGFIGIELQAEYLDTARHRIEATAPLLPLVQTCPGR